MSECCEGLTEPVKTIKNKRWIPKEDCRDKRDRRPVVALSLASDDAEMQ